MPSNQKQIIEQAKFTHPSLNKAFEKKTKIIEDQGEKQVHALKDLKLKDQTKSIEEFLQKIMKAMKLKMNCINFKDKKIKLLEITRFMNHASRYMILKYLK